MEIAQYIFHAMWAGAVIIALWLGRKDGANMVINLIRDDYPETYADMLRRSEATS